MDEAEEEEIIEPFSSAEETSDVVLIVEEKRIFAHKSILGKHPISFHSLQLIPLYFSENFSCF